MKSGKAHNLRIGFYSLGLIFLMVVIMFYSPTKPLRFGEGDGIARRESNEVSSTVRKSNTLFTNPPLLLVLERKAVNLLPPVVYYNCAFFIFQNNLLVKV